VAEEGIRSAWSVRPYSFGNQLNCCEVRNVHDDDDEEEEEEEDDDDI
jgi:hypothetical protein